MTPVTDPGSDHRSIELCAQSAADPPSHHFDVDERTALLGQTSKASRDKPSSGSKSHDPCRGMSPRRTHRRLPLPAPKRADASTPPWSVSARATRSNRLTQISLDQNEPVKRISAWAANPLRADPGRPHLWHELQAHAGWRLGNTRSHASRWMPSESLLYLIFKRRSWLLTC